MQSVAETRISISKSTCATVISGKIISLSGEWVFGNNLTQALRQTEPDANEVSTTGRLIQMLLKPLFLTQATSNERAQQLWALADGSKVAVNPWHSWLYNPIGKWINRYGALDYMSYRSRVDELETLRQQAVKN